LATLREFRIEVFFANGSQLQTEFTQRIEDGQRPASRFYLGYSSDHAHNQDLPWIAVGDIAYLPDEVVAVRIVDNEQLDERQEIAQSNPLPRSLSR
jgi:hypothetical protein